MQINSSNIIDRIDTYFSKHTNIKISVLFIVLNAMLFCVIGGYLEDYESLYASICRGLYTDYAINDYLQDFHTVLFSVYSFVNSKFPDYNVYGIWLYVLNILTLCYAGFILFKLFKKFPLFFFVAYLFLALDSILNISSNRIVIVLTSSVFVHLLLNHRLHFFIPFIVYSFCLLVKPEIVVLISFTLIVALWIENKLTKKQLILFAYGLFYFLLIQFLFKHFFSEARQTFLYYELDFFDKSNIDYGHLTATQLLQVDAFKKFNIVDKVHFTNAFYKSIEYKHFYFSWLNIKQCLTSISWIVRQSYVYVLVNIILIALLIWKSNKRTVFCALFLCLSIYVVSFIIKIPDRYLETYYALTALFFAWILITQFKWQRLFLLVFSVACLLILTSFPAKMEQYKNTQTKVERFYTTLYAQNAADSLFVINNVEYLGRYFPPDPFYKIKRQNCTFLNFWYFTTYQSYISRWEKLCRCNPLSLQEKVDFIISNHIPFMTKMKDFLVLKQYLYKMYKMKIRIENFTKVDKDLYQLHLKYQ